MKRFLKVLLIIVLVIVAAAAGLIAWLSIAEYKPENVEQLDFTTRDENAPALPQGESLTVLSWNIGYGGPGSNADFFMDGGENVKSSDRVRVESNLLNIRELLYGGNVPDLVLLQEVDTNSSRTYSIDQSACLAGANAAHALNYSCPFVPYPLPPIGRVNSGLLTTTMYDIDSSERISLPCPFDWPVSTANLKRCLLVSYLPIEGSSSKLVIVNLHLEAYDDGEGKIAQTKQLREFIQSEYEKGNYVIAGGDFNQVFPGGIEKYPNEHPELWEPGIITEDIMPEGWSLAYDLETPSCRLLNQPYDPEDIENTQYYVIDGFIISPNVELISVETLDAGFELADHNPVQLKVKLSSAV